MRATEGWCSLAHTNARRRTVLLGLDIQMRHFAILAASETLKILIAIQELIPSVKEIYSINANDCL
jgi:hypothetical protein